jgi:hypothetical protein
LHVKIRPAYGDPHGTTPEGKRVVAIKVEVHNVGDEVTISGKPEVWVEAHVTADVVWEGTSGGRPPAVILRELPSAVAELLNQYPELTYHNADVSPKNGFDFEVWWALAKKVA